MMIKHSTVLHFDNIIAGRKLYLIGAGRNAKKIANEINAKEVIAVDNNLDSVDSSFWEGHNIRLIGWTNFLEEYCPGTDIILVTPSHNYKELIEQIENHSQLQDADVYVYALFNVLQWDIDRIKSSNIKFDITKREHPKIPKKIHYFWFSGEPYSDKVRKCIESWHRYCPDYEIIKWDLNNYKTNNVFFNEAISVKRWAFASDYSRCDVIYRYGGIYLDTDVELIKSLDDLLYDDGFLCFESANGIDPGSGMGCEKGNKIFGEICTQYNNIHFINNDGSYNQVSILNQYTDILVNHGLELNGQYQLVDDIAVYPSLVMSPYSYRTGIDSRYEMTYGIHHWVSAWISDDLRNELNYIHSLFTKDFDMYEFLIEEELS